MITKSLIKCSIISVSDAAGLLPLAKALDELKIDIIATSGTEKILQEAKITTIKIKEITQFPEIMGGRIKTLHPKVHAGILARRGKDENILNQYNITAIDLVIVNLYPFKETIAKENCTRRDAIEKIDIGGPALLRSAAKNHKHVTVIVDPEDYTDVIKEIRIQGNTKLETRERLAQKAFEHTAEYDMAVASYFQSLPTTLRYGENPHQKAEWYSTDNTSPSTLSKSKQLQGEKLSFNNLMDSNAALNCVRALDLNTAACVIVKHSTPCGAAQAKTLEKAYKKALSTDPSSSFGGIVAFNKPLDVETAIAIKQQFAEVIIAPDFDPGALEQMASKKSCRLLALGRDLPKKHQRTRHSISGGMLIQDADEIIDDPNLFTVVTHRQPTSNEITDALFAFRVVRYVKSNAIVYAKNQQTMGIGAGQTSRVFAAKIAGLKAKEASLSLKGGVAASDAFYPFVDGLEVTALSGIKCVIQPGGSKRDSEVIDAANQLNLSMIFTHKRHFRH